MSHNIINNKIKLYLGKNHFDKYLTKSFQLYFNLKTTIYQLCSHLSIICLILIWMCLFIIFLSILMYLYWRWEYFWKHLNLLSYGLNSTHIHQAYSKFVLFENPNFYKDYFPL